jgi:hypothetical protein
MLVVVYLGFHFRVVVFCVFAGRSLYFRRVYGIAVKSLDFGLELPCWNAVFGGEFLDLRCVDLLQIPLKL